MEVTSTRTIIQKVQQEDGSFLIKTPRFLEIMKNGDKPYEEITPFLVGIDNISMRKQCSFFSKLKLNSSKQMRKTYTIAMNWMSFATILVLIAFYYMESFFMYKKSISAIRSKAPASYFEPFQNRIHEVVLGCDNEHTDQGRSYYNMSIDIYDCYFSRLLVFSGNGGVIYVDGGSYSMNVNYSMFYNCACSNHGGAIYFFSSNSNIRMVCANRCSCGNSSVCNGHFAIVSASQKNLVEYLSVSKCSHTTSGYCSIYLQIGNQRADNTNSSMNNVMQYSGIRTWSPSSFTSTYCTFSNNNVSEYICMNFYSTSGTISMSYANIVHNNSPSGYGIINVNGEGLRMMMYCIFKNNQDFLFCVLAGSLEVSHSFIDHSSSFCLTNSVSTVTNNSFINRITYQIQFFHSHHCNADLALIDRTPMITFEKSPMRTLEEKILIMVMLICFL